MSSESDILEDIVEVLESWGQRILELETNSGKTKEFSEKISIALNRQVLDGLISEQDSCKLQNIFNLWTKLHNSVSAHCMRTQIINEDCTIRDIVFSLLGLFELQQISKDFFINIVSRLWHNETDH